MAPHAEGWQHWLVFGLSADPVHRGHIETVALSADWLVEYGYLLADVLLVPVYRRNPVGPRKGRLPDTFSHRLAMCRLAACDVAERLADDTVCVRASAIEAHLVEDSDRPNYTAETLAALSAEAATGATIGGGSQAGAKQPRLIFLVGSELVSGPDPQLARWYRPDLILSLASLAICPRAGYPANADFLRSLVARGAEIVLLSGIMPPDISATELRERLSKGASPHTLAKDGLLTPRIARYLEVHPLYADGAGRSAGPAAPARTCDSQL